MKSFNNYGQNLMYGDIEFLAQHWDYTSGTTDEDISRFNYQDQSVQAAFANTYSNLYSVIASANTLLEHINEVSRKPQCEIYTSGLTNY